MAKCDIVVVGASMGGLEVLKQLVSQLPPDFPAAVFIVWHIPPQHPSLLPQILDRVCPLPVAHGRDEEKITAGRIYVAPPDHHLVIDAGKVCLSRGPKENNFRPSIDVLFRSAAWNYRNRVIGVILTGALDDGASGLYAVKQVGGTAIIQDPLDAPYANMPINAMKAVEVDHVLPVLGMGALLDRLVREEVGAEAGATVASRQLDKSVIESLEAEEKHLMIESPNNDSREENILETEVHIAREDDAFEYGVLNLGEPSPYTCPECHGILLRIREGNRIRYRCHTGHAFSSDSLLGEVTKSIETSLWSAVRVLQESQMLLVHLGEHLKETNNPREAEKFLQKAQKARLQGERIKQIILEQEIYSEETLIQESVSQESVTQESVPQEGPSISLSTSPHSSAEEEET